MATALGMTAAGVGIAVLPEAAAALAPAGVTRVAIRGPVLTEQIAVLFRAGRSLSQPPPGWSSCSAANSRAAGDGG